MESLNKKALVELVAQKTDNTKKDTTDLVDHVFEEIANALKEGAKVDIAGFGKFEVKERSERTGTNPQTKENITIPASKVPSFKASKTLKDFVK